MLIVKTNHSLREWVGYQLECREKKCGVMNKDEVIGKEIDMFEKYSWNIFWIIRDKWSKPRKDRLGQI